MSVIGIPPVHSFAYAGAQHNVYHAKAGQGLPAHEHNYHHGTIVHAGRLLVRKQNIEKILTPADGCISLKEREWHELEALDDGTVFENIFAAGAM